MSSFITDELAVSETNTSLTKTTFSMITTDTSTTFATNSASTSSRATAKTTRDLKACSLPTYPTELRSQFQEMLLITEIAAQPSQPEKVTRNFAHYFFAILTNSAHSSALEQQLFNGTSGDEEKPSPLLRSISKISTIPEEDVDFDEMSNPGLRRAEDCCTPTDPRSLRPLARAVQVPNRIRRLRSRHVQPPKNLWFIGSVDKSFNSRCSKRFQTKDLQQDAVHYYYYRSLPKISQNDSYLPSITTSIENIEPPKQPKTPSRRLEDLLL